MHKIGLGSEGLLQLLPEKAVGPLDQELWEVGEDLHEGDDQGQLLVVGGTIDTSPRSTAQKITQEIIIR